MGQEKQATCAWCNEKNTPDIKRDKSEYGDIVVMTCNKCGKIMSSYLDEKKVILEKVRTFQDA